MGTAMIVLYVFCSIYPLWVFYLAVMALKRAKDSGGLTKVAYYLGLPVLWVGYVLDAFVNIVPLTIILLEVPKEFLVTARLTRLSKQFGWRAAIARWMCANLLDPFDPSGCHCK